MRQVTSPITLSCSCLLGGAAAPPKLVLQITVDVDPTLAAAVGAKPPSGTRGKVLVEVLEAP